MLQSLIMQHNIYNWLCYSISFSAVLNIFITPSPVLEVVEGNNAQFACGPFSAADPLVVEINGTVIDPSSASGLDVIDFDGDNRTFTLIGVPRMYDGITLQCFSSDGNVSSTVTVLSVLCECMQFKYLLA